MSCDMWQMTHDIWHMTCETWCGVNILSKYHLSSSNGVMMFLRSGGKGSLTRYSKLNLVFWKSTLKNEKWHLLFFSVRLFVCLITLWVPFKHVLPPLPEVGCQIFLEIQKPWGKVVERFEQFVWKWSKIAKKNNFF